MTSVKLILTVAWRLGLGALVALCLQVLAGLLFALLSAPFYFVLGDGRMSGLHAALMSERCLFVVYVLVCAWMAWDALSRVIRANRQPLH